MQLVLRGISFISFIVAIVWVIQVKALEPEPILAFLSGLTTLALSFVNDKKENNESLDQRNRRVMLDHVENFWVKGVLEKSLHGVAMLELGIKEDPTAVNYPWGIKKSSTNETLPFGKSMLEIFKEIGLGRSLLILGTPGSGKTTMLLELTRQLIETARQDENELIPVIFNLASWTEKLSLADWLAKQLNIFYYVPKKIAQKLVTDNKMFLLLDGLDEVKEDLRGKCVNAINEYKKEYGLTSLVICSRIEEYQSIQTKLSLAGAITLQSLTSEQVYTYFEKFGKSLSSLKQILEKDKILRELAETPLILSIMVLAYKDVSIKEISELKNSKEQRKHLFDTYINRMFERSTRSEKKDFSKEETIHYLSWLANQMTKHNLITYQIEAMQSFWLRDKSQRLHYQIVSVLIGICYGIFVGLFSFIFLDTIGFYYGLMISTIFGVTINQRITDNKEILVADKMIFNWKKVFSKNSEYGLSGLFSFSITVFLIILSLIIDWLPAWYTGLLGVMLIMLFTGSIEVKQLEETYQPEQRLKRARYNALSGFILFFILFASSISVIASSFINEINSKLNFAITTGIIFGSIGGLVFGIMSLFQHYALRYILMKNDLLPRELVKFLEHSVDLIFLRRVGGSYIFVHRLLMEYFAEMYIEKQNK